MLKKIIIEGMILNHCVNHVKKALTELKNAKKIEVNLEEKYAVVETDSDDKEIKEKIEEEGYEIISIKNII